MKNQKKIIKIIFTIFVLFYTSGAFFFNICFTYASEVKIAGKKENWVLFVDDKPFYIKGVGCGLANGKDGEDYLKLAKELGANCVRTWGTDQGNKEYLDRAWKYGLMVDAGIWLNWADAEEGVTYIGENQYKKDKLNEALNYVREFKDHPAILMWNVGNEAIFFTKEEKEKIALSRFLEELIGEIHKIDPKHPVVYTSAAHLSFSYLIKYVPSLDIIGANTYAGVRAIHSRWDYLGFNKPYLITEFGPYLPNDSRRDINGKAVEIGDYQKASIYKYYASQLQSFKGCNLGGFVFHLGETTQESMTWWNLNHGELKKQSYLAIYEIYTGKPAPFSAPRIGRLMLSKAKNLQPNEIIDVEVEMRDINKEDYVYEYQLSTALEGILKYYVNDYVNIEVIGSGSKVKIKVPQKRGIYRLYCFVKDKNGNISSLNKSISIDFDSSEERFR